MAVLVVLLVALACVLCANAEFNPTGVERVYYIAGEDVVWDYFPGDATNILDNTFVQDIPTGKTVRFFNRTIYREYTDDSFSVQKPRSEDWVHLGIFGPVIRAEVGDVITIHYFSNSKTFNTSLFIHGVHCVNSQDPLAASVPIGSKFTYTYQVTEESGPSTNDPSSFVWMYNSIANAVELAHASFVGPCIIVRRGLMGPDGKPTDVDREFVLGPILVSTSFLLSTINGLAFGNTPGLNMYQGEVVRWYFVSPEAPDALHTISFQGHTLVRENRRSESEPMLGGLARVADMYASDIGDWTIYCAVIHHRWTGMQAIYHVLPRPDHLNDDFSIDQQLGYELSGASALVSSVVVLMLTVSLLF